MDGLHALMLRQILRNLDAELSRIQELEGAGTAPPSLNTVPFKPPGVPGRLPGEVVRELEDDEAVTWLHGVQMTRYRKYRMS